MTAPRSLWARLSATEEKKKPGPWVYVDTADAEYTCDDAVEEHGEDHEGVEYDYEVREGYNVIAMDPPWMERGGGKSVRGAQRHYPLLPTKEMPRAIIGSGKFHPAKSCHMYMWVTNNFLEDGLWLMKALGFTYITNVTWVKVVGEKTANKKLMKAIEENGSPSDIAASMVATGIGQYFRGAHELLLVGEHDPHDIILFGRQGSGPEVRTEVKNLPGVLFAPKREHSRKPDLAYELFEARSKGPKLEMFARHTRPGWDSFGNDPNLTTSDEE